MLVLAFVAPPLLAGAITLYARTRGGAALDPVATGATVPPRAPAAASSRRLAVIVAGNHYQRDVRWVRDRNRMSSGSLTAGLDATLAAIDTLAGRAAALRAASAASYRHVAFLDDPASALSRDRTGLILELAYRWERTKVAVVVGEGASESAIAALLDMYAATLTTDAIAVATSPATFTTRHGIRLVPHDTTARLGDYDHITFASALPAGVGSYDAALAAIATTHGKPMARAVARGMNYPTQGLDLDGGAPVGATMLLRALVLGLAGLLVRLAILRRRSRRRTVSATRAERPSLLDYAHA